LFFELGRVQRLGPIVQLDRQRAAVFFELRDQVLCNREDYGWRMRIRRMLEKGMSLEEIAENLNHKRVRRPHGSSKWSATAVRKAFVS
jgi:hypothetical protein